MSKKELIRLGNDGLVVGEDRKPVQTFKPGWVMLLVDTSQSMSSFPFALNPQLHNVKCSRSVIVDGRVVSVPDDNQPLQGKTALDVARAEAIEFANKARTQRYLTGLVAFDDDAKIIRSPEEQIPFAESAAALRVGGGTNMAAGIFVAATTLQQAPGEKAMVVISDGLPNDEDKTITAANNAKRFGVRIITIGVPGANEAFLRKIASDSDLATVTDFAQLGGAMSKAVTKLLPPPRSITRKG